MPSSASIFLTIFLLWYFFGDAFDAWLIVSLKEYKQRADRKRAAKAAEKMARSHTYKNGRQTKRSPPTKTAPVIAPNYRIGRDAFGRYTKVYDPNAPHDPEELARIEAELEAELQGRKHP